MNDTAKAITQRVEETKKSLFQSALSSIVFFILGGVITGVSYSLASPGGTYMVTSGLFLVGMISGVIAVWRVMVLLFLLAKRGPVERPIAASQQMSAGSRTWEDIE